MVNAIILINVAQGQVPEVIEGLVRVHGVAEAYSVAGSYDVVAIVRVRLHEELADLVAEHAHRLPRLLATRLGGDVGYRI